MDTIRSVLKYETLTTYFGEGAKLSSIRGAEFVSDINLMSDPSPYYRFSNALILEYFTQYVNFSSGAALPKYCWIKYTPYAALNLSERHSSSDKTQQILGFCPLETDYYGVQTVPIMAYNNQTGKTDQIGNIKRTPFKFIFTIKQYHLNSDVYLYYKAVNDQLAANQQILDPISVQTVGNIICTTNPEEHVLGVFEVASINIHTYSYDALNTQFGIEVNSVPVIDPAEYSDGDCYIDNPPNFWLK